MGTRAAVERLLAEGFSRAEIARRLNLSRSTVSYHARRLGCDVDERCARRYDWRVVQAYYDAGHSITECQERFGFARCTFSAAVKRGDIRSRPQAMPIEFLLTGLRNRTHLKRRLLAAGLLTAACHGCSIRDWRGQPLSLELHHVNGDARDNRLENLQLLCPNCHAQTENFAGRNSRRPVLDDADLVA